MWCAVIETLPHANQTLLLLLCAALLSGCVARTAVKTTGAVARTAVKTTGAIVCEGIDLAVRDPRCKD